jgi:aryl-alcohol dehydrogenase-like predicted oxidoreductase
LEYTSLGGTGIRVSRIGLGTWQFSEDWGVTRFEDAKAIVRAAIESGVNLFDTALRYGNGMSERFLGRALRELGVDWGDVVVVTKIPGEMLGYDDVFRAVEISLKRLGAPSIPVLLAHWPPLWRHVPICEYARAFERLVAMGKVEYIGLSDHPLELVEAFRNCLARLDVDVLQYKLNIVERDAEKELLPYAEELGATFLAWSPLAKGAVLGKFSLEDVGKFSDYRRLEPMYKPRNYSQILRLAEELRRIAEKYGKTPAQVALNWLLALSDAIIPIPGATKPEQVKENAGSAGWRLSWEDWRRLDELSKSLRISYVVYEE